MKSIEFVTYARFHNKNCTQIQFKYNMGECLGGLIYLATEENAAKRIYTLLNNYSTFELTELLLWWKFKVIIACLRYPYKY